MAPLVPVSIGWALWGKNTGTTRDYSVLASSNEPLSEAEFASVLGHFVPGTPPVEDTGLPGSLPWVTISRVGKDNQAYLGISVVVPSEAVDSAGRRASSTSYFCVSYGDLSEPISYADLYEGIRDYIPLNPGLGLIRLNVPRLDPGALATEIVNRFGEELVRATAAMLLSGPVSVIGAENTTLPERLLFLDAVAALLPYGYRAGGYTAATWSDSGTRHPIRLAFASRPRQNAGVIRWKSGPTTAIEGSGREYLELLRQVREQRAAGESSPQQLARLIGVLAGDQRPCGFDEPERAFAALNAFGLPLVALNGVRAAKGDPALVRKVFELHREAELMPGGQQELLVFLIETAHRERENWKAIDDCWGRVAGNDSPVVLPPMAQTMRGLLWRASPAPSATTGGYRELAIRHRLIDELLAALVPMPPGPLADHRPGAQAVAQNLADSLFGGASTAGLPQTRRALAGSPFVASLLLAQVPSGGRELPTVTDLLEPALGQPLAAYFTVLGRRQERLSEPGFTELARLDREYVVTLLDAASAHNRLDLVLPGFAAWLASRLASADQQVREQPQYWRTRAMELRPTAQDTEAWLDIVLMLVEEAPRYLLADRDRAGRRRYAQTMAAAWADLGARLGTNGPVFLTDVFLDYLRRRRWAPDSSETAAIGALVERLTENGQRLRLRAEAEAILTPPSKKPSSKGEQRHPTAPGTYEPPHYEPPSYRPASYEQGETGQRKSPTSAENEASRAPRSPASAPDLPALPPRAVAADVAKFCITAYHDLWTFADVREALERRGAIHSGIQAAAVLKELEHALPSVTERSDAYAWLEQLTEIFANGRLYAAAVEEKKEEFRSAAARAAMESIDRNIMVLRIALIRDEPALPGWQDQDTDQLNRYIKHLQDLRDNVKPRPRGLIRRRARPHNADTEADQ